MSNPTNYTADNSVYTTATDVADLLAPKSIFQTGGIWTWGLNSTGQLGNGTTINRSSPGSVVGGMIAWRGVSIGGYGTFAMGVKSDGTLWGWGQATYGRFGDGTTVNKSSPVTVAGGGTTWKQVAIYQQGGAAVKSDGSLWVWGRNNLGQVGDNSVVNKSSPVTISGGGFDWISCFGGNANSQGAIKQNGSLWMWGENTNGVLGDGTTVTRSSPVTVAGGGTTWRQVAVAREHSAAIKTDGTLWTWGRNLDGELGTGDTIARSSPGTTVVGGTDWKYVAVAGSNLSNPNYAVAAIKQDGTLWTWGDGAYGTIASSAAASRSSPATVLGGGTTWKTVRAGWRAMMAIKTDGSLWSWGQNERGQLGDGTTITKTSPVSVIGTINNWLDAFVTRSTGGGFGIGLAADSEYDFPAINAYTVAGNYTETIPEGFHTVIIEAWGGGGGGGDPVGLDAGGGGGSGGYSRSSYNLNGAVGLTISITVGAGGPAGGATNGTNTTVSSGTFSITTMTAGGGTSGTDFATTGLGGAGGTASGGTAQNTTGNPGEDSINLGGGGAAVDTNIVTYYAYGGGGGGALPNAGQDGAVVFKYT